MTYAQTVAKNLFISRKQLADTLDIAEGWLRFWPTPPDSQFITGTELEAYKQLQTYIATLKTQLALLPYVKGQQS